MDNETLKKRLDEIQDQIESAKNIMYEIENDIDDIDYQGDSSSETYEYWEGMVAGLEKALEILNKIK